MITKDRILPFWIAAFQFAALLISNTSLQAQTGLTTETWNNLTQGESIIILQEEGISDRAPDSTGTITDANLAGPTAAGSGTRLRGTITPALTDTYTFLVSGADNVALWISDDASRFNKKLVAYNLTSTAPSDWDQHADQQSIPIQLTAGQSYYIEAQVMDKDGGGHLEVAWHGLSGRYALDLNGATATQSSTFYEASRVIDGNTQGQSSQTHDQPNSWLQVDFGQDREINQVILHNNKDTSKQDRLSNFRISVLDANDIELVGQDFFTTSGHVGDSLTWDLPASQPTARKVKIQFLGYNLLGNGILSLAEVEAHGIGLISGQVPVREIVPQSVLNTVSADPDDSNDNNLSDTWESQTGLDTSSHPQALLEYGDPDNDGISNYQEQWYGSDPLVKESIADGLTRFIWMGISGQKMGDLTQDSNFYSYPNIKEHVGGVNAQLKRENYGARYRGSIVAPVTGEYRFWISGSGGGNELWLADGSIVEPGTSNALTNRFGKRLVCYVQTRTNEIDFDNTLSQRSEVIHLQAGQEYYIEALHAVATHHNDHMAVAWEYPGQARQIIPAIHFLSSVPLESDGDDDNLPDAWETSNSLDPADNGFTDLDQGEYGDPDGDTLTNLKEYQLGTDPNNADTDGDGYSDNEEVNYYGTDPLVSNNLASVLVSMPSIDQYSSATGSWYIDTDGNLMANERRGAITYSFTVTQAGVHEVVVTGSCVTPTNHRRTANLSLTLDNDAEPFATGSITSQPSTTDTMSALTPWLDVGTHTITIFHHNYVIGKRLKLVDVSVERLGGIDLDEDGIPDWVESQAALVNGLKLVPAQSRTSPLCIEGFTQQLSSTSLTLTPPGGSATTVSLTESINDSFYADIELDESGATTVDAGFLSGLITESHAITWVATNLFDAFSDDTLHIRKGDALRLDAWSGANPDGQAFSVTMDGVLLEDANQNTSHSSGVPFAYSFDTAGSYTLVATHGGQSATLTLKVHAADFGESHVVNVYDIRSWQPPTLGLDHKVDVDERIIFSETTLDPNTGPRTFDVKAEEPVNRHVIARIPSGVDGAPSAILARGTVHAFELAHVGLTRDPKIVTQYADGSWLLSFSVIGVNIPPNLLIELNIMNQGTLFANGSTVLELRAEDFDANGIAVIFIEAPYSAEGPKICTTTKIFVEN